ncbi:hypothetical protein [Tistlia consotensis]|uniref:hypothetical protein n=1 Tax=Tistlia consotensis TaxID=1321365 RepID=UPI00117CFDC2|nr:hypothetical protein [Tistlia consotensis]
MDEIVGAVPVSNSATLCIGGISSAEAERAREAGHDLDGMGYYLFLASQDDPEKPIEVLAKFWSASAAERLARMIAAGS